MRNTPSETEKEENYVEEDKQILEIEKTDNDEDLDAIEELIKEDVAKEEKKAKEPGEPDKSELEDEEAEPEPEITDKSDKSEKSEKETSEEAPLIIDEDFINSKPESEREVLQAFKGKSREDLAKSAANAIALKNPYLKDNQKAIEGITDKILQGDDESVYKTFIESQREVGAVEKPAEKTEEPETEFDERGIPLELPALEENEEVHKILDKALVARLKKKYPDMPDDLNSLEYREWKRDMVADDDEKANQFNRDKDEFTRANKRDLQEYIYVNANAADINNSRYEAEVQNIKENLSKLGLSEKDLGIDLKLEKDKNGVYYNPVLNNLMKLGNGFDERIIELNKGQRMLRQKANGEEMTPLTEKFFSKNMLKITSLLSNKEGLSNKRTLEKLKDENLNTLGKDRTSKIKPTLLTEKEIEAIDDEAVIDKELENLEKSISE